MIMRHGVLLTLSCALLASCVTGPAHRTDSDARRVEARNALREANQRNDVAYVTLHCETLQYRGYTWAAQHQREACGYLPGVRRRAPLANMSCAAHTTQVRARMARRPWRLQRDEALKLARCDAHGLVFRHIFADPPGVQHDIILHIIADVVRREQRTYTETGRRLRAKLWAHLLATPEDANARHTPGRLGAMMKLIAIPAALEPDECVMIDQVMRATRGPSVVSANHEYAKLLDRGCTTQREAARPRHLTEAARALDALDTTAEAETVSSRRRWHWLVNHLSSMCRRAVPPAGQRPDAAMLRAMEAAKETFTRSVPACLKALTTMRARDRAGKTP